jgi:opacity protein-like surface antigen
MSPITKSAPLVALMVFAVLAPAAQAQDERLRMSFAPAVATVSGDAELALGGTVGYRFMERVWFEGEFTWIDGGAAGFGGQIFNLDARTVNARGVTDLIQRAGVVGRGTLPGSVFPVGPGIPILPTFPVDFGPIRATVDGSTMIGTLGVRYELPAQPERFRPYLAAGLGIHNTDQEFRLERTTFIPAFDASRSHTGYAFSAGGGASVRLAGQLWADVDTKYFRLSNDRNIMRVGGGVSFRF